MHTINADQQTSRHIMSILEKRSAVCQLKNDGQATGLLIGSRLIITCSHFLPNLEKAKQTKAYFLTDESESTPIEINLDPDHKTGYFYVCKNPDPPKENTQNRAFTPDALDFTLVALEENEAILKKIRPLNLQSAQLPQGGLAHTLHYPFLNNSKRIQDDTQKYGCSYIAPEATKNIQAQTHVFHHISIDQQLACLEGSSGAPLFNDQGVLIGFHNGACALKGHRERHCKLAVRATSVAQHVLHLAKKNGRIRYFLDSEAYRETLIIKTLKNHYLSNDKITLLMGNKISIKDHYSALAIISDQEKKETTAIPKKTQKLEFCQSQRFRLDPLEAAPIQMDRSDAERGKDSDADTGKNQVLSFLGYKLNTLGLIPSKSQAMFQLEDLFKTKEPKQTSKKRILIQGIAGIGKSTLCQKIAYEWANNAQWLKPFKAVFLLKFRNLNTRNHSHRSHVYQVIATECFLDQDVKQQLCDEEFRKHSLVILDGYDELSDKRFEFATSKRQYLTVLEAFEEEFPNIILTTRPRSQKLRGFDTTSHLEIIGFQDKEITSYIEKFFPQDKQKEKALLRQQLQNPQIRSLCYIPINLEILCSFALENKIFLKKPLMLSEIYEQLTNWLINRFRKERLLETPFDSLSCESVHTLNFIEHVLEEMAYKMMQKNTVFITQNEIRDILNAYEKTPHETIEVQQIGPIRIDENGEGQFIHSTFQEFFAAKYLVRLFKDGKEGEVRNLLQEKKFHPRYQRVLSMTTGLLMRQENQKYLHQFFNFLYEKPRDLGSSRELILLAKYFEECGEKANEIVQYGKKAGFIEQVINTLIDPKISPEIKFELLNKNYYLIHHARIIQLFIQNLENTQTGFPSLLFSLSQQNALESPQIINKLSDLLIDPQKSPHARMASIKSLGEIAIREDQEGNQTLQMLIDYLLNTNCHDKTKNFVAHTLVEVAKRKDPPPEKLVQALIAFLIDPVSAPHAQTSIERLLSTIAKKATPLAENTFRTLVESLIDSLDQLEEKSSITKILSKSIANILGEKANSTRALPDKGLEKLVDCLISPMSGLDVKQSISYLLEELAKSQQLLPPLLLEKLSFCLLNSAQSSAIKQLISPILEAVVRSKHPLPENTLDNLASYLIDPRNDPRISPSISFILEKVASEQESLPENVLLRLIAFLNDKMGDLSEKHSALSILEKVVTQRDSLTDKTLEGLITILTDSTNAREIRKGIASLLEILANKTPLPETILLQLIGSMSDPIGRSSTKRAIASILEKMAHHTSFSDPILLKLIDFLKIPIHSLKTKKSVIDIFEILTIQAPFSENVLEELSLFLTEAMSDPKTKRFAIYSLGVVARNALLPEKILEKLIRCLIDENSDPNGKLSVSYVLETIAKGKNTLPEKVLLELCTFLKDSKSHPNTKRSITYFLEEAIQKDLAISEKVLSELCFLLQDSKSDPHAKRSIASFLEKVLHTNSVIPECFLLELSHFLIDPISDPYAQNSIAFILEKIAKRKNSLPDKILKDLSYFLTHSKSHPTIKQSVASILREAAKRKDLLPQDIPLSLCLFLKDPEKNSEIKCSVASILEEIMKGSSFLAEKILEDLSLFLRDPLSDETSKRAVTTALEKVGRGKQDLPLNFLFDLSSFLVDPMNDPKTKRMVATILSEVARKKTSLPQKIVDHLIAFLIGSKSDLESKYVVAYVIGEVVKSKNTLHEKLIDNIIAFLVDPTSDPHTQCSIVSILEEMGKRKSPLPQEVLEDLIDFLIDPIEDPISKQTIAYTLKIISQSSFLPLQALEDLVSLFISPTIALHIKQSIAYLLEETVKSKYSFPKTITPKLSSCLTNPSGDSDIKNFVIAILRKIAEQDGFLPKKTLEDLSLFLKNPQGSSSAKIAAACTLKAIIEHHHFLSEEVLDNLTTFLKDSKGNHTAKISLISIFRAISQKKSPLAEKALEKLMDCLIDPQSDPAIQSVIGYSLGNITEQKDLLPIESLLKFFLHSQHDEMSQAAQKLMDQCLASFQIQNADHVHLLSRVCKKYGKALYQVDKRYYISDQSQEYPIKEGTEKACILM